MDKKNGDVRRILFVLKKNRIQCFTVCFSREQPTGYTKEASEELMEWRLGAPVFNETCINAILRQLRR